MEKVWIEMYKLLSATLVVVKSTTRDILSSAFPQKVVGVTHTLSYIRTALQRTKKHFSTETP